MNAPENGSLNHHSFESGPEITQDNFAGDATCLRHGELEIVVNKAGVNTRGQLVRVALEGSLAARV
jgi:hypothetical protein